MKYISVIILSFLLIACASPSQRGLDYLNGGNAQAAYDTFHSCSLQGDSNCMSNIGYMYEQGKMAGGADLKTAIAWYTLAARYGNPVAQQNLLVHKQPIPQVDLVAQTVQNDELTPGVMALILGAAAVQGAVQGYNSTPTPTSINCSSTAIGNRVNTRCR